MKIYNSLTKEIQEFVSIKKNKVGMYTCGPTVYDFDHVGHGRKYTYDDILRRVLIYLGNQVTHVQNITDVGHLTGENNGDADTGEDKLEKGAKKVGKTVWDIANEYTHAHFASMDLLNILRPTISCKATEHIQEQIDMVQTLVNKGFAYDTPEAVYFSVSKFPRYDGLFGQHLLGRIVAVRDEVKTGDYKRSPEDFCLWFKRVGRFANHSMHWDSPWGDGFPGWHIECSAMSMKYLGMTFDIHTGGEDHLTIHHPNEIAQSEAATGKPFANYWLHHAFLLADGTKMSKSLGNVYRIEDVVEKGFSPLALRYLYLTAHYRTPLNFTWSSLTAAQSAYDKLVAFVVQTRSRISTERRTQLSPEKLKKLDVIRDKFLDAISEDLALPRAIAVVWELLKSNIPNIDKLDQLLDWDEVLGLGLGKLQSSRDDIPSSLKDLLTKRDSLRATGDYVAADDVRLVIEKQGYEIIDTKMGSRLTKK